MANSNDASPPPEEELSQQRIDLLKTISNSYKMDPFSILYRTGKQDLADAVVGGDISGQEAVDTAFDNGLSWGLTNGLIKEVTEGEYRLTEVGWDLTEIRIGRTDPYRITNPIKIAEGNPSRGAYQWWSVRQSGHKHPHDANSIKFPRQLCPTFSFHEGEAIVTSPDGYGFAGFEQIVNLDRVIEFSRLVPASNDRKQNPHPSVPDGFDENVVREIRYDNTIGIAPAENGQYELILIDVPDPITVSTAYFDEQANVTLHMEDGQVTVDPKPGEGLLIEATDNTASIREAYPTE